jgi:hypothetical protein
VVEMAKRDRETAEMDVGMGMERGRSKARVEMAAYNEKKRAWQGLVAFQRNSLAPCPLMVSCYEGEEEDEETSESERSESESETDEEETEEERKKKEKKIFEEMKKAMEEWRRMVMNTKENVEDCMEYARSVMRLAGKEGDEMAARNFFGGMDQFLLMSGLYEEIVPFAAVALDVWKEKEMTWHESGALIKFVASMIRHCRHMFRGMRSTREEKEKAILVMDQMRELIMCDGFIKKIVKGLCAPIEETNHEDEYAFYAHLTYIYVFCAYNNEAAMTVTAFHMITSTSSGMENLLCRLTRAIWKSTNRRYQWELTHKAFSFHEKLLAQFPPASEQRLNVMDHISSARLLWEKEMAGDTEARNTWYFN